MISLKDAMKRSPRGMLLAHKIIEVIDKHVVEIEMGSDIEDRHDPPDKENRVRVELPSVG
jgi:hypothetical protein